MQPLGVLDGWFLTTNVVNGFDSYVLVIAESVHTMQNCSFPSAVVLKVIEGGESENDNIDMESAGFLLHASFSNFIAIQLVDTVSSPMQAEAPVPVISKKSVMP